MPRRLWDHAVEVPPRPLPEPISVPGPGLVVLGQPYLRLIDLLDRMITRIALRLGAVERQFPTLLPTEALRRSGYLESFPELVIPLDDRRCLPPTLCFHAYHQLTGATVAGTTVVTCRGKAFRDETGEPPLERLSDFTIRETVFLGHRDDVRGLRDRWIECCEQLVRDLSLSAYCEVASDPFVKLPQRRRAQLVRESKLELCARLGGDRSIAAASVNLADDVFGRRFGIVLRDGSPAHSGCVGFGLERLAYAFAAQHGTDERDWPACLTH